LGAEEKTVQKSVIKCVVCDNCRESNFYLCK